MRVAWLTGYLPQGSISPGMRSEMASVRYRLLLLVAPLIARGVEVYALHPDGWRDFKGVWGGLPDVLVVPKLGASTVEDTLRWQNNASEAISFFKERGTRVVADFCDIHFDTPVLGEFQSRLVSEAHVIVASTPTLAEIVFQRFGVTARIIGDPYENPRGAPDFTFPKKQSHWRRWLNRPRDVYRLLWYGHPSNFPELMNWLRDFDSTGWGVNVALEVITTPTPATVSALSPYINAKQGEVAAVLTPWSVDAVWQGLRRCHCVVIPTQVDHPAKAVKSPNRVVEAIQAGRFVVANPLPSYQAFSKWIWLGDELELGLLWMLKHPQEVRSQVIAAQAQLSQHYSPEIIARQWSAVFRGA